MTTPSDDGLDPETPGTQHALENYPEFFTYPAARPEPDARPHIPAARGESAPAPGLPDRMPSRERLTRPDADPGAPTTPFTPFRPPVPLNEAPVSPQSAGWPSGESPRPEPAGRSAWQTSETPASQSVQPPRSEPSARPRPTADDSARYAGPGAAFATGDSVRRPESGSAFPGDAPGRYPESGAAFAPRDSVRRPESGSAFPADAPARYSESGAALNADEPPRRGTRGTGSRRPATGTRRSTRSTGPVSAPAPTRSPTPTPTPTPQTTTPGRGRRRAKRSLAATLWPFHAMRRTPVPASKRIRSRSTAATVWRKLKADRAAVFGGYTIVLLILLAVFAPVVSGLFGVDPTTLHPALTDATFGPHGSFGGMSWSHPLGVDQRLGRDVLARLLYGSRVSLLIAFGATVLSVGLGAGLGVLSGYLGGRVDTIVMRIGDVFLAFPLMLFALGLTGALSDEAFGLSGNGLRIAIMIFVMGFFNWPYIARIVRAEVLSLREREFVDAARALGAGTRWVVWRELMPNLMAPILVYATLLIPANIIFEAGLSALGIGLDPPAASWGQMMTDAIATVYTDPAYLIVPGMAVFITVLAFNLFGDGLRDALDPTAQ